MKKSALFEAILSVLLILLLFAMYLMVTTGRTSAADQWAVSGVLASPDNTIYGNAFSCENGMLYTVDGKSIYALDGSGNVIWDYAIPDGFLPAQNTGKWTGISAATDDNNDLYVIVSPDKNDSMIGWQLLAISPAGKLLWNSTSPYYLADTRGAPDIKAHGNRLYYFTGQDEYILDLHGNEIKWISDVYGRPSVDEDGTLYLIPGMFEGNSIEAYGPDGSLLWSHGFDEYGVGNITVPQDENLPIYSDHTLYIWLEHGALALNQDGSLKWEVPFDINGAGLKTAMFDTNGDVYMVFTSLNGLSYVPPSILVLHPDGSKETLEGGPNFDQILNASLVSGGVAYDVDFVSASGSGGIYMPYEGYADELESYYTYDINGSQANLSGTMPYFYALPDNRSIGSLDTYDISAYDVTTGDLLWSYVMPLSPQGIVLNASNVDRVLFYADGISDDNKVTPAEWYGSKGIPEGTKIIGSYSWVALMPAKDLLYVNFWSYNYQVPAFYNESKCVYSGGIYALDKSGRLAWDRSTGSRVTYMEEKNGTVYFGTGDGKISATSVDVAAGAALLAAAYLFIRFLAVGAVSRARDRLDKNDNRNKVLQFIAQNPGATMYDVSRGLGMNPGTARYHLLILGINHRIVAHRTDLKYIRYFTNSGSYSGKEQMAMSLVRRDGMRKILGLLIDQPGLSHTQISGMLDMPESSLSRYMKELSDKGIVDRDVAGNGTSAYFINGEHRQAIVAMIERIKIN